jgi:hypothetical protein
MDASQVQALLNQSSYTQMTVRESALVREWLTRHAADYDEIEFNVRLGDGVTLPFEADQSIQRQARLSTQRRADIIATNPNHATIVELKSTLNEEALLQLQIYQSLYSAEHPEVESLGLTAAGYAIEPETARLLADYGVTVELYPKP